jgi:hypothetical protein
VTSSDKSTPFVQAFPEKYAHTFRSIEIGMKTFASEGMW